MQVSAVSNNLDIFPPVCEIIKSTYNNSCFGITSSICNLKSWNALIVFWDENSGIQQISFEENWENSSAAENETLLKKQHWSTNWNRNVSVAKRNSIANFSATCCTRSASIRIVDTVGLSAKCEIGGEPAEPDYFRIELKELNETATSESPTATSATSGTSHGRTESSTSPRTSKSSASALSVHYMKTNVFFIFVFFEILFSLWKFQKRDEANSFTFFINLRFNLPIFIFWLFSVINN